MKKVFVDTNIVIRIFVKDDQEQFNRAKDFFQKVEQQQVIALISLLVISEVIWILEKVYHIKRSEFISQVKQLLALKNVQVFETDKVIVVSALELLLQRHIDFTDAYLFEAAGNNEIFSFDADFKKLRNIK